MKRNRPPSRNVIHKLTIQLLLFPHKTQVSVPLFRDFIVVIGKRFCFLSDLPFFPGSKQRRCLTFFHKLVSRVRRLGRADPLTPHWPRAEGKTVSSLPPPPSFTLQHAARLHGAP